MGKDKRYEIQLPLDGRSKPVVYKVSGSGVVTIEKVDGKSADTLPAHERDRIIKAIKDAPRPGNELPEGEEGSTKPGSDAGRPDQSLPGREGNVDPGYGKPAGGRPDQGTPGNPNLNPNPDVDADPDLSRPDKPDQSLPEGGTPDQELPEAPEPKA